MFNYYHHYLGFREEIFPSPTAVSQRKGNANLNTGGQFVSKQQARDTQEMTNTPDIGNVLLSLNSFCTAE